jgi:excisionase family DNA binding protein
MRPRTFTIPEAAAHMRVSERTIRDWIKRGWLKPIPGSHTQVGHHLIAEPALADAEHRAKWGRTRRRRRITQAE